MKKITGLLVQLPELVGLVFLITGAWQDQMEVTILGAVMFTFGVVNKIYLMVHNLHKFMMLCLISADKVLAQLEKGDASITISSLEDERPVREDQ